MSRPAEMISGISHVDNLYLDKAPQEQGQDDLGPTRKVDNTSVYVR